MELWAKVLGENVQKIKALSHLICFNVHIKISPSFSQQSILDFLRYPSSLKVEWALSSLAKLSWDPANPNKTEYKTILLFVKQCVNVNQLVYMYKYGFYVNFRNKKTALFLRNHYSYFTWDISLPLQIAMIKRIPWYPISSIEMTESPQQSPSQPPADPKKEFPDIVRSLVIFR